MLTVSDISYPWFMRLTSRLTSREIIYWYICKCIVKTDV